MGSIYREPRPRARMGAIGDGASQRTVFVLFSGGCGFSDIRLYFSYKCLRGHAHKSGYRNRVTYNSLTEGYDNESAGYVKQADQWP